MPRPKQRKNNGVRYSEADKMVARRIVLAAGGIITDELLEQVRTALRIPTLSWDTLQRWMKPQVEKPSTQAASTESRERKVPVVESVEMDYQNAAARDIVEQTFRQYAKQANNSTLVEKTEAKDAAKVMTDMLKLMQLLDGMPTEIIGAMEVLNELAAFVREHNLDFTETQRQFLEAMKSRTIKTNSEIDQNGGRS
jgi:hypothetical protein